MQSGFVSLLWFVGVIALIPVALWLLKRTPLGNAGGGRGGTPKAVAVLPLSAQHKLVTIEVGVGDEKLWLVLGVSPQGVRTLHTMSAQPDEMAGDVQPAAAFAQLLSRMRGDDIKTGRNAL